MDFDISAFLKLLFTGLVYLVGLDWKNIEFDSVQIVYILSVVILLMLLFKLLFVMIGRHKFHRKYSGHFIFKARQVSKAERTLRLIVPVALTISLVAFIVVLAGANKKINSIEYIQTEFRQLMVLFDDSVSVGWESNVPKKAWAEIMRNGYGEFLNLRAGKKDRVSIWIFAKDPYLISDFVTDPGYLRDRVFKAPYVLIDPDHFSLPESKVNFPYPHPKVVLPEEKMMKIPGEGSTHLALALQEMLKYLDREGDSNYASTTFIVVTDGAPNTPVDKEFELLKIKKIKLLVLYMYNSTHDRYAGNKDPFGWRAARSIEDTKKFQEDVIKYGGYFYKATNLSELREMYRRLDEQETVKYSQKVYGKTIDYSENFLRFGTSVLFFIVLTGMFFSIRKGISP